MKIKEFIKTCWNNGVNWVINNNEISEFTEEINNLEIEKWAVNQWEGIIYIRTKETKDEK